MRRKWIGVLAVGSWLAALPLSAQEYPELSTTEEVRLAMSAGPVNVSKNADVWVLRDDGFEKVIEGDNGFSCLVVRSAANRGVLAPHCLDPFATRSVLPSFLAEARMQMAGMDATAIEQELDHRLAAGTLPTPEGPAYAYMLSEGQRIGPNLGNFRPHFMLYVPNATNESIGGDPGNTSFPFVGPRPGHALSTVVIMMETFVSPSEVQLPERWTKSDR